MQISDILLVMRGSTGKKQKQAFFWKTVKSNFQLLILNLGKYHSNTKQQI